MLSRRDCVGEAVAKVFSVHHNVCRISGAGDVSDGVAIATPPTTHDGGVLVAVASGAARHDVLQ